MTTRPARPGVTLEPRTALHADALFAVVADPELYRFIEEAPPASVDALRAKLARSESRRSPDGREHWLNWIVRDARGRVAGHVQATVAVEDATDAAVNVAYVIGRDFQGRGIATEAVDRMMGLVHAEFGARRFVIVAERANAASLRLARRLGFVEETGDAAAKLSPTETVLAKHLD